MNPTKIEWATRTWNPVTGCNHACPYCYARRICESPRFNGRPTVPGLHVLDAPVREDGRMVPWPVGFAPTCHAYRYGEPKAERRAQAIFVCDMGDLFGEWVPEDWIGEVLENCREAPQHTYLFLTKNPRRYHFIPGRWWPEKCFLGASASNETTMLKALSGLALLPPQRRAFISLEPLLDTFRLSGGEWTTIQGLIIGGLTGPGARKPSQVGLASMVGQARSQNLAVFVKANAAMEGADVPHDLLWSLS